MWYIASEENQAYLAHHGVRGMKWGTRKQRRAYQIFAKRGGTEQQYKKVVDRYTKANELRKSGKGHIRAGLISAGVGGLATGIASGILQSKGEDAKALAAQGIGTVGTTGLSTALLGKGIYRTIKGNTRMKRLEEEARKKRN